MDENKQWNPKIKTLPLVALLKIVMQQAAHLLLKVCLFVFQILMVLPLFLRARLRPREPQHP
jgi:hypothetical protein